MSNLLNIKELRNRMLQCRRDALVSVAFLDGDVVELEWFYGDSEGLVLEFSIEQIRANCRVFERAMHKAKRTMRGA